MGMESISQLKGEVAAYLENNGGLSSAKVLAAFPGGPRDFPLRIPTIVVGVESVELAPAGFGGYWGEGADPVYGSGALITLRFDLYSPPAEGGDSLHDLYEALCDRLLLRQNPFGFLRLWCGETAFDKAAGANHLTARATLRTALTFGDDSAAIERFDIVRKTEKE